MAAIASTAFLNHLKVLYPSHGALTPDAVIAQPWYLVASVAFSASRHAEAVPAVFQFALNELKMVQVGESPDKAQEQQFRLVSKIREALLQSGLLSGMPRVRANNWHGTILSSNV